MNILKQAIEAQLNKELEKAELLYLEALKTEAHRPELHHNLAGLLAKKGKTDQAISHFKTAIKLKPNYAEAYQALTEAQSCKQEHDLLNAIEIQLEKASNDNTICYLRFAAAKICADQNKFAKAFKHYQLANKVRPANFSVSNYQTEIENQISYFNLNKVAQYKEFGLNTHQPIFIIGMPRSGTSLIEQILSSHSDVFGVGELGDIAVINDTLKNKTQQKRETPFYLDDALAIDVMGFGLAYLNRINELSHSAPRVIDKNPLNFLHLGFILRLFPNAKIIHSTRDPIDTCLSCYFQNFTKNQDYAFNLTHLAKFYNGYQKLMDHWNAMFPNKIYNVEYEKLVANQEQETEALLEFCDLSWQDDCLTFHNNKRSVSTASKFQVRQPIYSSSIKRWKHYEPFIGELLDNLEIKN